MCERWGPIKLVSGTVTHDHWSTESMSISHQQRTAFAYHGLHLVPRTYKKRQSVVRFTFLFHRIAAAGAALFLATTFC